MKLRFGLRSKLLLLSGFLFTIPWFGYQYVWEMEKYLRFGQEQTIIGTARALATALHERPKLFNNQASFLPSVEKGKDLYGYQLYQAIQLDGIERDWPDAEERRHYYGKEHLLTSTGIEPTLHFTTMLGKYDNYLYLIFSVVDNKVIMRDSNARSIRHNDHLELSYLSPSGEFKQFIISNKQPGWLATYQVFADDPIPQPVYHIQGNWLNTPQGYNLELRIPLSDIGDKIAFAINDVDQALGSTLSRIGSADPAKAETLGTILVPSPEIERIVKGMSYSHSRVWVVDQHKRVLAKAGDIKKADGLWQSHATSIDGDGFWQRFEQRYLHPLYYKILTRPASDFIDLLYDASNLSGKHIDSALNGQADSQWRLSQDQKAVILSAAYPIYIDNQVHGAVIVEETTNGIRTLRNRALEKLFSAILAILLIGTLVFFIFASRISGRIRALRDQTDAAIDEHGRIRAQVKASTANDEIGDLSRSFASVVKRLSQYNHYLENMSSRLSHELRTPIAVVRTSLENLTLQTLPDGSSAYIERAQGGVNRLNKIITEMSEATRLEQMLQHTEKTSFNLTELVNGCMLGYQQIYPDIHFVNDIRLEQANVLGSPEHIAQCLDKIIANAVEFSLDGQVFVQLAAQKSHYCLRISNNGPLLPSNMQDNIFDSMVSLRDKSGPQHHLGLGLYIARLIVEFHRGSIRGENRHNPDGVSIEITLAKQG